MLARKPVDMNVQSKTHIDMPKKGIGINPTELYLSLSTAMRAAVRLGAIFVAMLVISTTYQTMYDRQASVCAKAENEVILLKHEQSMLELEVTELKAPNRIQTIAVEELGMVSPSEYIYSSTHAKVEKQAVHTNSFVRD